LRHQQVLAALAVLMTTGAPGFAAETDGASASASGSVSLTGSPDAAVEAAAPASDAPERELSKRQNTLDGTTGLLRVVAADSDVAGTFRFSLYGTYYTGSEFLCPECSLPDGTVLRGPDDATQVGTRFGLSFTPVSFLEGFAGMRFQTSENSKGDPTAVHIVGDTNLGLKGFLPQVKDRLYGFGGSAELALTNQPGGVGVDAASFRLRALGTLDFDHRSDEADRIPIRAHANLSYFFDNSGVLADEIELRRRSAVGTSRRITRVERFGHDINRVDSFGIGLGVEGTLPIVHPFLEWTIDVPVNRDGHVCRGEFRSADDACLVDAGFSAVPSRLTLGARAFPWFQNWTRGLALLIAFDIGTGATATFIEEVAPETPWAIHLGLAYGFDTEPRIEQRSVERVVEAPLPPEHRIMGVVVRVGTDEPVPGAVIRYEGQDATGMVANSEGKFESGDLPPGAYVLAVSADGFAGGSCAVTLPESNPGGARDVTAWVECSLEALPQAANVDGIVRDAATTVPIEGASVKIIDPLGRSLTLTTDAGGAFRFENVKSGASKITVSREGYLPSVQDVSVEPRKDRSLQVSLNAEPEQPKVIVTATELKIKEQIQFLHGSAEIVGASEALIQEIARTLRDHPEIVHVEVQGHTDDSGTREFNAGLSQRRAEAVKNALVRNGVDATRLTSKGYGQDKPLAPNTSPGNRGKNRRVQFMIDGKP
jgi:outer membrane protein OmpA-like peptidoglycan-associated protein